LEEFTNIFRWQQLGIAVLAGIVIAVPDVYFAVARSKKRQTTF